MGTTCQRYLMREIHHLMCEIRHLTCEIRLRHNEKTLRKPRAFLALVSALTFRCLNPTTVLVHYNKTYNQC